MAKVPKVLLDGRRKKKYTVKGLTYIYSVPIINYKIKTKQQDDRFVYILKSTFLYVNSVQHVAVITLTWR